MNGLIRTLLGWLGFWLVLVDHLGHGATPLTAWSLTWHGLLPIAGGADSEWATGSAEAVKKWSREAWVELPKLIYWNKFMGRGLNNVIQVKEELESTSGDQVTFSFIRKLQGAGVTGDSDLEDQEEEITPSSDAVVLDQVRQAIRLKGLLSERRTAYSQRSAAKELLTTWLAEKIDADIFAALDSSPSTAVYAGTATSTATLTATDYLTTAFLTKMKTKAKKAVPKIWPVKVGTKEYYIYIAAPDQEHDLKVHDASWSQAQREAQMRGDDNPVFEGSTGVWDGVIVHIHEDIALSTDWGSGSNVNGASGIFVGRQAGAWAWGSRPRWVEKSFDYDNKTGFAIGAIYGVTKAVFNSVDHAMISGRTARTSN